MNVIAQTCIVDDFSRAIIIKASLSDKFGYARVYIQLYTGKNSPAGYRVARSLLLHASKDLS